MEKKTYQKKEKNPMAQDVIRLEPPPAIASVIAVVDIGVRRCCRHW
jgi:hypothetical protein